MFDRSRTLSTIGLSFREISSPFGQVNDKMSVADFMPRLDSGGIRINGGALVSAMKTSCSARARGFAYIWTLMLVAFMGVGTVIASELYSTSVRRDKERELLFIGHEFRAAIGRYYNSNAGGQQAYPLTLGRPAQGSALHQRQAAPAAPVRRSGHGQDEWGTVVVQGRIVGVHSLSAQIPIKQDNFDDNEGAFRHKQKYSDWVFTYPADLFVPPKPGAGQKQP